MCQGDFYVPVHQGRADKAILAHTSLAAGCYSIRTCSEATLSVEIMLTEENWKKCKCPSGTSAFSQVFRQQEPMKTDICCALQPDTGCQVQH